MTDPVPPEEATLFPKSVGERLREAREAQGLSLAEIAARTRVPVRQLEAIETDNYTILPSITYSVGFAKAYARAVGLDEVGIARDVRGSNDQAGVAAVRRTDYEPYEIDEPARVPTRGLAIGAAIAALLVVIAAGLFYGTTLFRGEDAAPAPAPVVANTVPEATPAVQPTPTALAGPVVLTATDEVWLKVYQKGADGTAKTLRLGTLAPGESYTVPADATAPLINVGRPDQLKVTVGGVAVAPLGDGRVAIKDVPIDAASLNARGTPQAAASPGASTEPAPTTRATPRPAARATRAGSSPPAPLNIAAPAPVAPEPAAPTPAATPAP